MKAIGSILACVLFVAFAATPAFATSPTIAQDFVIWQDTGTSEVYLASVLQTPGNFGRRFGVFNHNATKTVSGVKALGVLWNGSSVAASFLTPLLSVSVAPGQFGTVEYASGWNRATVESAATGAGMTAGTLYVLLQRIEFSDGSFWQRPSGAGVTASKTGSSADAVFESWAVIVPELPEFEPNPYDAGDSGGGGSYQPYWTCFTEWDKRGKYCRNSNPADQAHGCETLACARRDQCPDQGCLWVRPN